GELPDPLLGALKSFGEARSTGGQVDLQICNGRHDALPLSDISKAKGQIPFAFCSLNGLMNSRQIRALASTDRGRSRPSKSCGVSIFRFRTSSPKAGVRWLISHAA